MKNNEEQRSINWKEIKHARITHNRNPNLGIRSNVFLLCSLLRRKRAKAKLNQMQTKLNFFSGGVKAVSTT